MNLVTTQDLKEYLQSLCKDHVEIRDVFYYSSSNEQGTTSVIVIVEISTYINFRNSITIHNFGSVEKAIAHYNPSSQFAIVDTKVSYTANTLLP